MKDLILYSVEFRRNFGFGFGTYTWFVSRPNYSRKGVPIWTSDSVFVLTTNDSTVFDMISNMDKESAIRYIKLHATDRYRVTC